MKLPKEGDSLITIQSYKHDGKVYTEHGVTPVLKITENKLLSK